jgi:hypothetical protein
MLNRFTSTPGWVWKARIRGGVLIAAVVLYNSGWRVSFHRVVKQLPKDTEDDMAEVAETRNGV